MRISQTVDHSNALVGHGLVDTKLGEGLRWFEAVEELGKHELVVTSEELYDINQ